MLSIKLLTGFIYENLKDFIQSVVVKPQLFFTCHDLFVYVCRSTEQTKKVSEYLAQPCLCDGWCHVTTPARYAVQNNI